MALHAGVVDSVAEWMTITKRDGGETQKRSLIVRDSSGWARRLAPSLPSPPLHL